MSKPKVRLVEFKEDKEVVTTVIQSVTIRSGANADAVYDAIGDTNADYTYRGPDIVLEFVSRDN
mgnify:FL=1